MRVTLNAINEQLAKRGTKATLARAVGYFYFTGGEADQWLNSVIPAKTINTHTLEEWLAEYDRLKNINKDLARSGLQRITVSEEKKRRATQIRETVSKPAHKDGAAAKPIKPRKLSQ